MLNADMKTSGLILLVGLMVKLSTGDDEQHALFFNTKSLDPVDHFSLDDDSEGRHIRQTEFTVRSILEWLQGRYTQPSKKTQRSSSNQEASASQPARQYLPVPEQPTKERPRPFQPKPTLPPTLPPSSPSQPPTITYIPAKPSPPVTHLPPSPSYPQPPPSTLYPFPSSEPSGYPKPQPPQPPFPPSPYPQTEYQPLPTTLQPPGELPYRPTPQPSVTTTGLISDGGGDEQVIIGTETNDIEGAHPPHIHNIAVECAKDQMTINLEFNREFNGVIYSKGFYNEDSCRYVNEGTGQTQFSFTVRLNACGTQFIDEFKEGGQAYLENVLVIQNELGIQEVWDTVRRVRCLWEGNIRESLSVSLAIGMLNQEIVTFSGDTAIAHLDIQMGRGPFAPAANGLVTIGETMTLVVSVEGDPGFDIQVRDCVARDVSSVNVLKLTDEQGCILRPKLFGAFQKTRNTGASGASIIAYAFFQAFKFPDVMDLTIECNVELCKTNCESCPLQGQNIDPARRRRRDIWVNNSTLSDPVRVLKTFRVITPDDLEEAVRGSTVVNVGSEIEGVCMSLPGFLLAAIFLLSILVGSCLLCTYFWFKMQRGTKAIEAAKTVHLETFPISKA
ncbi:uncharacterized protein LOC110829622 [Zootermopsis nevadensis]|nr:uncharacterized protein LOC110829622 [Zootermopsis nevadensis]XP_021919233.1 uncharacterized protein LOC110829622 [Zootermopsis nevadensis]XP_021919234.1 uncharacterized protein LOC110829622 [Zootermopsis nevadensis]